MRMWFGFPAQLTVAEVPSVVGGMQLPKML